MLAITLPLKIRSQIWVVGVSFVLFQFFMQLSSGIIIGSIMEELKLTAFQAGLLASSFYIAYTLLQIPVGILFDSKNTKMLLSFNAALCSIGCLIFSMSHHLSGLFIGRILIGTGSAFAFIGFSHLLRQHFPLKQFAFMIGLSETLAFMVTVLGMVSMGKLVHLWGWNQFIHGAGLVSIVISWLCFKFIPDSESTSFKISDFLSQLKQILHNLKAWINGLFVGLNFTLITVFGALWSIPFLQCKLMCPLDKASLLGAVFFLGAGISCPLFGWLSTQFKSRKKLIFFSCLATNLILLIILYAPITHFFLTAILLLTMGCTCGSYMLAYSIANEIAPPGSLSTCTGFTNTLAVITAPLFQPLIGFLLDNSGHQGVYTLSDYQYALMVIPISIFIATILVLFLPEN